MFLKTIYIYNIYAFCGKISDKCLQYGFTSTVLRLEPLQMHNLRMLERDDKLMLNFEYTSGENMPEIFLEILPYTPQKRLCSKQPIFQVCFIQAGEK